MADMTYSDSAASIQSNMWFRSRVQVAVSKYTNYLLNAGTEDPDHDAKVSYGTQLARSYASVVDSLMFTLSGDAEVLAAGPAISDAALQPLVEKTLVKLFPAPSTPAIAMPGPSAWTPPIAPPPVKQ